MDVVFGEPKADLLGRRVGAVSELTVEDVARVDPLVADQMTLEKEQDLGGIFGRGNARTRTLWHVLQLPEPCHCFDGDI